MATDTERTFGGSYDTNVYYHPENCGLELIGELDDENACYSYDTLIVVRDLLSGDLYAAADSGCSCLTPFEDFRSLADMTPIRTLDDLKSFVHANSCSGWTSAQRQSLYRKVRRALVS